MEYTSKVGDRPTQAHVNYACPCGCVAGLTYDQMIGAEHLGRCCCGRLLWVGVEGAEVVRANYEGGRDYRIDAGTVTLPWGENQSAVLAEPLDALAAEEAKRAAGKTPTKVIDPVCQMMIDPDTAVATSYFQGTKYYFCAEACKVRFEARPKSFVQSRSFMQRLKLLK